MDRIACPWKPICCRRRKTSGRINPTFRVFWQVQVCVGGTKEQYERLVPILSSLGTPRYIGDVGKASTLKLGSFELFLRLNASLALNYILGANVVAFSNAYGLMEEAGVDTNMFIAVLNNGPLSLAGGYYKYAEIKKLLILPASGQRRWRIEPMIMWYSR